MGELIRREPEHLNAKARQKLNEARLQAQSDHRRAFDEIPLDDPDRDSKLVKLYEAACRGKPLNGS